MHILNGFFKKKRTFSITILFCLLGVIFVYLQHRLLYDVQAYKNVLKTDTREQKKRSEPKKTAWRRDHLEEPPGSTALFCIFKSREYVFKTRKKHVLEECSREGKVPLKINDLQYASLPESEILLFEMTHGLLYCPILKVGSTFMTRTLVVSSSNGTLNNPFAFRSRLSPTIYRLDRLKSVFTPIEINKAFKNAISFMAVRDPYTKLFSGYADKLFHPNYLFWRTTGRSIQWLIREDSQPNNDGMCGQDITFAEFIKYIIHKHENGNRINGHFVTLHQYCDPCKVEFDYILKLETFKDDTMFLLRVLNERYGIQINFTDFEQETAVDNAKQHILISFSTRKLYGKKCGISPRSFLFRTWRYLQISGIISKNEILPVKSETDALLMSAETFLDIIKAVIAKTKDRTEVRLQRREALRQAYQSVEMVDLIKLRNILEPDCRYFDYDCNFETLLSEMNTDKANINYFDAFRTAGT